MVQEAAQAAESAGLLGTLGIDYKLFLAQLVNFGVVLFVIWKFVYGPLMKVLDERSAKIEQGLKDAEESAKLRSASAEDRDRTIAEARVQAREIIERANADAAAAADDKVRKAKEEVERIVLQGKDQLHTEREKMLRDAQGELAGLLVAATEKIARERLDEKKDAALIADALKK